MDIKPDNVMIKLTKHLEDAKERIEVKLIDFGISCPNANQFHVCNKEIHLPPDARLGYGYFPI